MHIWEESASKLQVTIEEYTSELAQKPECEAELSGPQHELLDIDKRAQTQESRVSGLRTQFKLLGAEEATANGVGKTDEPDPKVIGKLGKSGTKSRS